MLLFLNLDESSDTFKLTFFSEPVYKATVESYNTILNNPFERYSISDLSKKYAISESCTNLKKLYQNLTIGRSVHDFLAGSFFNCYL